MSSNAAPDPELLLRHASFVRALARRLASDPSAADDLVQDTWLAVLERPLEGVRSPRGWLAGVLANLWRQRNRGEIRRRRREQEAAIAEALPPPSDMIEAAETGCELVDLVLALEEPFRSAVLLRYYEDLPPRTIASRLGVPVKTVDSRLARGLERLRARWLRRHGDDARTSLGALVAIAHPFARPAAASASAPVAGAVSTFSIGAVAMSTKLALSVVAVLSCSALIVLWLQSPSSGVPASTDPEATPIDARATPPRRSEPADGAILRTENRFPAGVDVADPASASADARAERRTIRGRVLTPDAQPLAGVEVVFRCGQDAPVAARAHSGAAGSFELEAPRSGGVITAEDPGLVTLLFGSVRANTSIDPLVVVAPFRDLGGRVVDDLGTGLVGARVTLVPPPDFAGRFDAVLDATETRQWGAQTDGEGRFELARAPILDGSQVVASLDGYVESGIAAPLVEDRALEIRLARPALGGASISGRVEDPSGRSVARSRVTLGARATMSDARGEFHLSTTDAPTAFELVALGRGFLPGRVIAAVDPRSGAPSWPGYVVVRLGGAPLAIAGRVVDRNGEPRPGLRIWVSDPTRFGLLRDDVHAKIEYLLASKAALDSDAELSQAHWSAQSTDAHGRFRIEGLLPRAYSLRALDGKTLGALDAGPFDAGEGDARIGFDPGDLRRIEGRVVTRAGHPVESVAVRLLGATFEGVWEDGGTVITPADGRFAFDGVGANELALWIRGDEVVSLVYPVGAPSQQQLEVTVSVVCHFKVECSASFDAADELRVLDDQGQAVKLLSVSPSGETSTDSYSLTEGRSKALGVSSDARTLVLSSQGQELVRVPLDLVPGRLNLVRP